MGFIENLIKGFIRSTVNQVGRDSGKVISNKIYKDKHATPIRVIGRNQKNIDNNNNYINLNNDNEIIIPEGYERKLLTSSWYIYFFLFIGSIVLYPISWIYYLYGSFVYLRKKTVTYVGYEKQSVYKQDNRYKTGKRYIGSQLVKTTIEIPANKEEKRFNKKKALLYLFVFVILYVLPMIYAVITDNK